MNCTFIEIQSNKGLIFKLPITGDKLHPPRKQLAMIKQDTEIEDLTIHYFRHILITALGDTGTISNASLRHTRDSR